MKIAGTVPVLSKETYRYLSYPLVSRIPAIQSLTIWWDFILHLRICATPILNARAADRAAAIFVHRHLDRTRGMVWDTTGAALTCVVRLTTDGNDSSVLLRVVSMNTTAG